MCYLIFFFFFWWELAWPHVSLRGFVLDSVLYNILAVILSNTTRKQVSSNRHIRHKAVAINLMSTDLRLKWAVAKTWSQTHLCNRRRHSQLRTFGLRKFATDMWPMTLAANLWRQNGIPANIWDHDYTLVANRSQNLFLKGEVCNYQSVTIFIIFYNISKNIENPPKINKNPNK